MSSPFDNVTLSPADLPQPPTPQTAGTGSGGYLEFYGPGHSGASPPANYHAEVSPVFGGEGPG